MSFKILVQQFNVFLYYSVNYACLDNAGNPERGLFYSVTSNLIFTDTIFQYNYGRDYGAIECEGGELYASNLRIQSKKMYFSS